LSIVAKTATAEQTKQQSPFGFRVTVSTSGSGTLPDVFQGDHDMRRRSLSFSKSQSLTSLVRTQPAFRRVRRLAPAATLALAAVPAYAQQGTSPWENAVNVLRAAFTGPIATGLSLVAIVVGGLMFAYGEGQSKRMLAGIVFGVGMAIGAVNFMAWLFPA
jgi:type IV secretion system protein TrbC